ncbi:protease inhibitor I42 family protein [Dictyobacter arantiisoli]|uniref:protease inhibitor I42 family protein n=1 Tax=Dictyobacter arantiisoli TaxID=2014874 RepID=UPI00155ADCBB|nr:protease inhibitor I42 family protein [Dictyobacter arantiisoli]
MRNIHRYISLCCLLLILCAFRSVGPPAVLTGVNNGSSITVTPGTQIIVRLIDNPSTGYDWRIIPSYNHVLQFQGKQYFPWVNPPGKPPIVGAPGIVAFTFIAQSSGTTLLQFAYQRPWEKVSPDVTYFRVTIHVRYHPGIFTL